MDVGQPGNGVVVALLQLQEASLVPMALFDSDDVLRWSNASFRAAYWVAAGTSPTWSDIMRGCHAQRRGAVVETDDIEVWLAAVASRRGKLPHRFFEVDLSDGRWLRMTETALASGWLLCVGCDITELRQDQRALRQAHVKALRASQTDGLTGLCNRVHALELLGRLLVSTREHPVCVAALDLDHFKSINDSLGHAAGDAVIRDFARLLQAMVRRRDCCGRIGGEEFLLVLSYVTFAQARDVLERLLAQVRVSRPFASQPGWGYTCSAGLTLARDGESVDDVVKRADEAMYAAKRAGRDRLVCA